MIFYVFYYSHILNVFLHTLAVYIIISKKLVLYFKLLEVFKDKGIFFENISDIQLGDEVLPILETLLKEI